MSHVTASLAIITDLECLKRVLAKRFPKCHWIEGKQTYEWNGEFYDDWGDDNEHRTARARGVSPDQYGKCDHVIRVDGGKWEVGVTKRTDGQGYTLVWDMWRGHHINKAIGQDAEILMTAYNQEFVSAYAETHGYMVQQEVNADGNLVYTMMS
jgi:hypothetical protein